jgi:mRNA interferase HicA
MRCSLDYTYLMKRRDLLKQLAEMADAKQVSFVFVREGANHTVYRFGENNVPIPRHNEIPERLARSILRKAEAK